MTAHDPRVMLTEVLAAHDDPEGWYCDDNDDLRYQCNCGASSPALARDGQGIEPRHVGQASDWHRAHVAEAIETTVIAARLAPIRALADEWRYKGDFGWGAWQEGQGPDLEGWVLDIASSQLRAALDAPVSASQDHDGAEGQGEVPWSRQRVHIHPPYEPTCNERRVDGQLRGACLNDDGSPR